MLSAVNPYFLHLNTQSVLKFGNFDDEDELVMAKHRVQKSDDMQNVPAGEPDAHFMHEARQIVKQEHDLIKQVRASVTDIDDKNQPQRPDYKQLPLQIDQIELQHLEDTIQWLEQLISHLHNMRQYVQEKLTLQHKNSANTHVQDAYFDAYKTLIHEYDRLLESWQPVLNLYKNQKQRLPPKES